MRDSNGASPRSPLLCQRCTRPAILTQVAAASVHPVLAPSTCVQTEQLNNIISWPLPLLPLVAIQSTAQFRAARDRPGSHVCIEHIFQVGLRSAARFVFW